jgi:hypothetical protein
MSHTKGQCNFPISYVLRENEGPPDNEDEYETQEELELAMVPLRGAYYDEDNHAVFDSLKSRLLNGPAWTWIQDFDTKRDGRGAWKALYAHFEGVSRQIRMKTAAYASIKRAEYKGAKNFDFYLYKRIHTQAHADLKHYGEPYIPEMKKVKDFLDGITEPSMQPVKYTLAQFPNLMNDFSEAANYISQIVDLNKKNDSVICQVSSSSSSSCTSDGSHKKGEEDVAVAEEAEEEEAEVEEGGVVENPSRVQADGSLTTTGKQCRSTKKRRYEPNEVIMQKGK